MFDLVAGFCHSQALSAFVALDLPSQMMDGDREVTDLAFRTRVPVERLAVLLNAVTALGLLRRRGSRYGLSVRGASLAGVPGLSEMIAHHRILYDDLKDPVAFFRGETDPALARFWPYVFGAGAAEDPDTAKRYSALMADSQALVAQDTLATVSLSGVSHLMDIGGRKRRLLGGCCPQRSRIVPYTVRFACGYTDSGRTAGASGTWGSRPPCEWEFS